MKKNLILFVSILLLTVMAVPAMASAPHPSQMGDQGGALTAILSQPWKDSQSKSNNAPQIPEGAVMASGDNLSQMPATIGAPSQNAGFSNEVIILNPDGTQTESGIILYEDGVYLQDDPSYTGGTTSTGGTTELDWYNGGQELFKANPSLTIRDLNTGVTWSAKYINGANHADVIPASSGDASTLLKNNITGSYVRRPVVVTCNGTNFAGSMYAVGHGETDYCDYFDGVMCIHFTGSKTHGTGKVDSDHQAAIAEALAAGN